MREMKKSAATLLVLLLVAACSGATKIGSHLATDVSLAGKKTYSILDAPEGVGERTPQIVEFITNRISPEVKSGLAAKGYQEVPQGGALLVAIHASQTGKVDAVRWGYSTAGWDFWGPAPGSGASAYGYMGDYKTFAIVIDVVDAKNKAIVFRCWADAVARLDGQLTQDQIRAEVLKMLKDFPASS
jgi:hypothetical protein